MPRQSEPNSLAAMLHRTFAAIAGTLLLSACVAAPGQSPATSASISAGVAAANDPRAGEIGTAIMRQGGSATDAAIAMMLAFSSGIIMSLTPIETPERVAYLKPVYIS